MAIYAEQEVGIGERPASIARHMLGLCNGMPGARRFRQLLSEGARELKAGPEGAQQMGRLLRGAAALCAPESMASVYSVAR